MKNAICLFSLLILLFGCTPSELSYSEVKPDTVNNDVKEFVTSVEDTNGIHFYEADKNTKYIFFNEYLVEQGKEAHYFEDIEISGEGQILTISFTEHATAEYANKSITNRLLYEVKTDKDYESVKLLKNGEEIALKVVSGSGK
ncbi:hypothetical protein [Paenisporosarcina sp.]|uniref:hypothetical protein n=1 Tax=Paenisporosarcina sp. TaxID=1932001 RepID=UPI003C750EFC